MEDMRKLLEDHEAQTFTESLAFTVRGLTAVLVDMLRHGSPSDSKEKLRYHEMIGSVAHCAEMQATMLARAVSKHCQNCPQED